MKIFKKLSKYKDLEIEISKMWHMGRSTISVVVGAVGLIGKDSNRFIEGIPGSPCLKEIQKMFSRVQPTPYERLYLCQICVYVFKLLVGKSHDAISDLRSLVGTRKEMSTRQKSTEIIIIIIIVIVNSIK